MNRSIVCSSRFAVVMMLLSVGLASAQILKEHEDWPNHQTYSLLEPRGTYMLDFDKIYETVASLDVETMVSLPPGYRFSLTRPGSIDFINVFVMQNTLFFTRVIDHNIATSIVCNVVTPTGETKRLILKIRGGPKEKNIVYAIHFAIREEIKERDSMGQIIPTCDAEIEQALLSQERRVIDESSNRTMVNALPAFFKKHRGSMSVKHKGAEIYIDGVIFTDGDAYVYFSSNVKRDNCDIVKLLSVMQGKNELHADLVTSYEKVEGGWAYIYRAPLQRLSKNKQSKVTFIFEIWSKKLTYKAIIS